MPEGAIEDVHHMLDGHFFLIKVSGTRKSKHGDFRPAKSGYAHRISVNGSLNSYAFLITLVHEIAHMHVWEKYKSSVKPHGPDWKQHFRALMIPLLLKEVFPEDIMRPLSHYLKNPGASTAGNIELSSSLAIYDPFDTKNHLTDLAEGSHFYYDQRGPFVRKALRRKRILCEEVNTGKKYLFHPLAKVHPQLPA